MSCRYDYILNDYQGNVRAVIGQSGALEEVNGYYPYGGITGAPATGVQPLKYGGKELDRENGLDWLDFEARHYDPMLPHFNSMDRKAEDYSSTSPYAYCAANPIRYIDPTGMNPVYDRNGMYLGDTSEGFTGDVLVMHDGRAGDIDIAQLTAEDLLSQYDAYTLDELQQSERALSGDALSNIWTNILSHFEGISINGEVFTLNRIKNGRVGYSEQDPSGPYAFITDISGSLPLINGTGDNYLAFESTVENLAEALLHHEWYGHGIKRYGNRTGTHHKVYECQIKTMLFHKTTDQYKEYILNNYLMFILKEVINK